MLKKNILFITLITVSCLSYAKEASYFDGLKKKYKFHEVTNTHTKMNDGSVMVTTGSIALKEKNNEIASVLTYSSAITKFKDKRPDQAQIISLSEGMFDCKNNAARDVKSYLLDMNGNILATQDNTNSEFVTEKSAIATMTNMYGDTYRDYITGNIKKTYAGYRKVSCR